MNSGVTSFASKGKISYMGTHQKFDRAAYRLISPLVDHHKFPLRKNILRFEGYNGPDGLKFKGNYDSSHMWDPQKEIGYLPSWIDSHFSNLVKALKEGDIVRAAFDCGWMAHYLTDGLTPAHHIDNEEIEKKYAKKGKLGKQWMRWGSKGLMSTHVAFEMGIASTLFFSHMRLKFDKRLYDEIKEKGVVEVFKGESLKISQYDLYIRYLKKGWTVDIAKTIKAVVAPRIPQLVSAAWLVAYEQAGYQPKFENLND
ncbi:MAG: zinc dependent phospholipase C family protein [bacterium]|nr:zinc dependent phospholipase C family protein [bacterium]